MKLAKITKLNDREHLQLRPEMYIGSVNTQKKSGIYYNGEKFVHHEVEVVDGLLKIINEIIDNSVDEAIKTDFTICNRISVKTTDDGQIIVQDNGRGLPTEIEPTTGLPAVVVAFTHAKAGSNFEDDDNRKSIGTFGVGAFCTTVFSSMFEVESFNGTEKIRLICEDNLDPSKINYTIKPSRVGHGTIVKFVPDYNRFNLKGLNDVHTNLIYQRLVQLAASFPQINFKFNGRTIAVNSGKQFLKLYGEEFEYLETEKWFAGIFPNDTDDFLHATFVNGLTLSRGGTATDYVINNVVNNIKEKTKKYKSLKHGDIKNKLKLVVVFREFPNPKFDSQTKDILTNAGKDVSMYLNGNFDAEKLANKIFRNPIIFEPIIELHKIKEEFNKRKELQELNKDIQKKKIKSDNYLPSTGNIQDMLFLCEGLSASGGLSSSLGREGKGYYSMRGVPLNAYEEEVAKCAANKEYSEIVSILGLIYHSKKEDRINDLNAIPFNKLILAQDQDSDGFRIAGILIAFFAKHFPNLIRDGKLFKLRTPVIAGKNKKGEIDDIYFDLDSFNEATQSKSNTYKYYKGLGSWKSVDLKSLISKYGIDYFLQSIVYTEDSETTLNNWMTGAKVEYRKHALLENTFSIFKI